MGLTASVDPTAVRTGRRGQHHITDLRFLEQLAEANGYFLWVDDQTLFFKKARSWVIYPTRMGENADEFFATAQHRGPGERHRSSGVGPGAKTKLSWLARSSPMP